MSLLKQLLLSVTVAISCILAGTLMFSIDGARDYLNTQLQVQSENAATSLALSLSQPHNQDPVTRELLMSALFDTGQFRNVRLTGTDGEVLFERATASPASGGVPTWFSEWLPFDAPVANRAVSDGWRQVGDLSITADDRYARQTLWSSTVRVFLLVVGAGILWALAAILLIRWLKRALNSEISEQVRAIVENGPDAPDVSARSAPRMKELAQARTLIESVRERVRATAEEQHRQIETLQVELHSDEVTGLPNRKYFINELRRALHASDDPEGKPAAAYGHVLIFRQRDLVAINAANDRAQADAWLRNVGDTVKRVLETLRSPERPTPQLARLNGSDFVVLLAGYDGPDTTDLIHALRQALDALRIRTADNRLCRWSYALTDYVPGCDVGTVLARLDHGLMRAENAGHDEVEYLSAAEYRSLAPQGGGGEMAWKALIHDALEDNRLELEVEPAAYRGDDTPDRHEALLVLRDADGPTVSGYLFMPPAVRLGLSGACDVRAIQLGLKWVKTHPGTVVLRVSLASLLLPGFLDEVEQAFATGGVAPEDMHRLILEVDAHGFVAYPDELEAFCALADKTGAGVGVRRLAEQPAALLRLHRVNIRYIKLGGDLIAGLLDSPGAMQLIAAITEAAIGQGVRIYAHDVPNAPTAAMLTEYGVLMPMDETFEAPDDSSEGGFVDN